MSSDALFGGKGGTTKDLGQGFSFVRAGEAIASQPTREMRAELVAAGATLPGEAEMVALSKVFDEGYRTLRRATGDKNQGNVMWHQLFKLADEDGTSPSAVAPPLAWQRRGVTAASRTLLGCLPRSEALALPGRHLGLAPAHELEAPEQRRQAWAALASQHLNLERLEPLLGRVYGSAGRFAP